MGREGLQRDLIYTWSGNDIEVRINQLLLGDVEGIRLLELVVIDQVLKDNNFNNQIYQLLVDHKVEVKRKIWQKTKEMNVDNVEYLINLVENNNQFRVCYLDTLIYWFENFNIASKIDDGQLNEIFRKVNVNSNGEWFTSKDLVNNFPTTFKRVFLSTNQNIELLLNNFTNSTSKYYFPKNITSDEYTNVFMDYLEADYANLNYLKLVRNSPAGLNKYINLKPKLKLSVKKRVDELNKEIMEKGITWTRDLGVFSDKFEYEGFEGDKVFLDANDVEKSASEPATILNFINSLDGLWTNGRILNLPSFVNLESSVLERSLGIRSIRHYEETVMLHTKLTLVLQQISIIQHILKKVNSSLESVLDFFFGEYSKEVGVDWISFELPKVGETMYRNSALFPAEENVRKQWQVFVENNELNIELFAEVDVVPSFAEVPSLLSDKYAYPTTKLGVILDILFSDQSRIKYIDDEYYGKSFVDLILKKAVPMNHFHDYQKADLNKLIEYDIITLNDDSGKITMTFKQQWQLIILKDFWFYGVINMKSIKWISELRDDVTNCYVKYVEGLKKMG